MLSVHAEVAPPSPPHDRRRSRSWARRPAWRSIPSTSIAAHRGRAGRPRRRAGDVGQPGLRRPALHPAHASTRSARVRELLDRAGSRAAIEVDGGIDLETVGAGRRRRSDAARRRTRGLRPRRSRRRRPARCGRAARHRRRWLTSQAAAGAAPAGRPHVSHVRVRYAETDQMGVAYYANYLVWFEVGAHRLAPRRRLDLPRARSRGSGPAGHRGALRIPIAGALRRRTGGAGARPACVSPVRLAFDYDITGADGALSPPDSTVHALLDRPWPSGARAGTRSRNSSDEGTGDGGSRVHRLAPERAAAGRRARR